MRRVRNSLPNCCSNKFSGLFPVTAAVSSTAFFLSSSTRWCQQQQTTTTTSDRREEEGGVGVATVNEAATPLSSTLSLSEKREQLHNTITNIFTECTSGASSDEIAEFIAGAKSVKELRAILYNLILKHPLMCDVLSGHGYRIFVFAKLSTACVRMGEIELWFEAMTIFRNMGFLFTRTFAASAQEALKKHLQQQFLLVGRDLGVAKMVLTKARDILQMSVEDGVPYDWVLWTRSIILATNIVATFDRQNLYRDVWPENDDLPRRAGIVPDWVISHERATDFDEAVTLCNDFVRFNLELVRKNMGMRPPFSFMQRLADYYFATDNTDGMIAVVSECHDLDMSISESVTAKLMQLVCSTNHPKMHELLIEHRIKHAHCTVATPDMFRTMIYFCRSGGGYPCPHCGEPSNHRNVFVEVWKNSSEEHKNCPLLAMSRMRKTEYSDNPLIPQNKDWSEIAFQCWEISKSRGLQWGTTEWRSFVLCCTFVSPSTLAKARDILLENYPDSKWDDYLSAFYLRMLRFNDPKLTLQTFHSWSEKGFHISPLVLQEAIMGVALLRDADLADAEISSTGLKTLHDALTLVTRRAVNSGIALYPYTVRWMEERSKDYSPSEKKAIRNAIDKLKPFARGKFPNRDGYFDLSPGSGVRQVLYGVRNKTPENKPATKKGGGKKS